MSTGTPTTPVLDCRHHEGISYQPVAGPSSINGSTSSTGSRTYGEQIHPLEEVSLTIPPALETHVSSAAEHLRAGRCVAIPTETVYGLAASSLDKEACRLIYRIKNRPSDNPLIMHVSSLSMLRRLLPPPHTYVPSRLYMALITAFWPGPLTLLFPSPSPPPLPAPQTNGIRMPAHPLALAVIHTADLPLSAPSANSSGRPSPTRAEHVVHDIGGAEGLGCILDGGDCGVGVESTVVDGLGWKEGGGGEVNVLRPGGLGVEAIAKVIEQVDGGERKTRILVHGKPWRDMSGLRERRSDQSTPGNDPTAHNGERSAYSGSSTPDTAPIPVPRGVQEVLHPSTPGMKYRHYSPRIPVYLALPSTTFPSRPRVGGALRVQPHQVLEHISAVHSEGGSEGDNGETLRIGLLHYADSKLSHALRATSTSASASASAAQNARPTIVQRSLGEDATSAAQLLFSSMLDMERGWSSAPALTATPSEGDLTVDGTQQEQGVDAIIIEGCTDEGLGLAVMERVRKAVGGGGVLGDVSGGEGQQSGKDSGVFWVDLGQVEA